MLDIPWILFLFTLDKVCPPLSRFIAGYMRRGIIAYASKEIVIFREDIGTWYLTPEALDIDHLHCVWVDFRVTQTSHPVPDKLPTARANVPISITLKYGETYKEDMRIGFTFNTMVPTRKNIAIFEEWIKQQIAQGDDLIIQDRISNGNSDYNI